MPKVSIIIPVYNSEDYLDRCLQSVIGQSLPDWECILVDDGSKDGSSRKCDEYAKKDIRFKVYHRANHGPSSSRNYGIDNAQGEYICFIDSDDYVGEDYLKHLVEPMEQDKTIGMTVVGMQQFGALKGRYPKEPMNITISSKKAFYGMLGATSSSIKGWLWNKCVRNSLLQGYRMQENLRYCEDLEMLLRMLYERPEFKVKLVGEYDYYYFIQETGNNLSNNAQNTVEMLDKFELYIHHYPDSHFKRMRMIKNAYKQCRCLLEVAHLNSEDQYRIKKARKTFLKNIGIIITNYGWKDALQFATIMINYNLFRIVFKKYHQR